jgi:hypothetical protein
MTGRNLKNKGFTTPSIIILILLFVGFFILLIFLGKYFKKDREQPTPTPVVSPSPTQITEPSPTPTPEISPEPSPTPTPVAPQISLFSVSPLTPTEPVGEQADFFITATVLDADEDLRDGRVQIRMPATGIVVSAPVPGPVGGEAIATGIRIKSVVIVGNLVRVDFGVDLAETARIDMAFRVFDAAGNSSAERFFFVTSHPGT